MKAQVMSLPEVSAWPELANVFERSLEHLLIMKGELPMMACRAVGGDPASTIPGAAAIACLQCSLVLIDDMLDEDPRGSPPAARLSHDRQHGIRPPGHRFPGC